MGNTISLECTDILRSKAAKNPHVTRYKRYYLMIGINLEFNLGHWRFFRIQDRNGNCREGNATAFSSEIDKNKVQIINLLFLLRQYSSLE